MGEDAYQQEFIGTEYFAIGMGFNRGQKIAREFPKLQLLEFCKIAWNKEREWVGYDGKYALTGPRLLCYHLGVLHGFYASGGKIIDYNPYFNEYGYDEKVQIGKY